MIYFSQGKNADAEQHFLKAIERDPKYGDALYNLAVLYAMKQPKDSAKALRYYQEAVGAGVPPEPELEKKWEARGTTWLQAEKAKFFETYPIQSKVKQILISR